MSKELQPPPDYTRSTALSHAVSVAAAASGLKSKLDSIVKITSTALDMGVSLLVPDSAGRHLAHTSSWGLPKYYIQKGLIEPAESLGETISGHMIVADAAGEDGLIQYPDFAKRARIKSVAGIPVKTGETVAATLRLYVREGQKATPADLEFAGRVAGLIGIAMSANGEKQPCTGTGDDLNRTRTLNQLKQVDFAHESEVEFAKLLDFYNITWIYEPRSFVLKKDGNRITEMFSPDFYLPDLDLYVELTTLKQSLITQKNRKIRRLRELYPDINITLMNKNNYDTLLAKYGAGPLGSTRAHGISRVLYTKEEIQQKVEQIAADISADYVDKRPVLLGIQRGFICFMADLIRNISVPLDIDFMAVSHYTSANDEMVKITKDTDLSLKGRHVLLVEDIIDTGMTLGLILNQLKLRQPASLEVCTLLDRRARRIATVNLRYVGFVIEEEFVVGYGLDYKEEYRNLPFIGIPQIVDDTG